MWIFIGLFLVLVALVLVLWFSITEVPILDPISGEKLEEPTTFILEAKNLKKKVVFKSDNKQFERLKSLKLNILPTEDQINKFPVGVFFLKIGDFNHQDDLLPVNANMLIKILDENQELIEDEKTDWKIRKL